jgi:hypothetical protein
VVSSSLLTPVQTTSNSSIEGHEYEYEQGQAFASFGNHG